jgi:hypothetical protein
MGSLVKLSAFFAIAILGSFLLLSSRTQLTSSKASRTVLGAIQVQYDNQVYKVVKLSLGNDVLVEIYKMQNGTLTLDSHFELLNQQDLHYDFSKGVGNLFATDMDSDQENEIIVPVMGRGLETELKIIKRDKENKKFYLL